MKVLRYVVLASLAVALLTGLRSGAQTAPPRAPAEPTAVPSPDQQVAALIEAYRALPAASKVTAEGDRIIDQLHMVQGKLSPRSQEAVARVEASHTIRAVMQALQKNDRGALQLLVSKQSEREILAERLAGALPFLEPAGKKWDYKVVAESYLEKIGSGELAVGLSQLGEDGWELVGFEKGRFVFKREK